MTLTTQEKQVVELYRSLDPKRRRYVLMEMAGGELDGWKRFHEQSEARLHELARKQGLDWAELSDEQRQQFIERLTSDEAA